MSLLSRTGSIHAAALLLLLTLVRDQSSAADTCQNGAVLTPPDDAGLQECACPQGYHGAQCELLDMLTLTKSPGVICPSNAQADDLDDGGACMEAIWREFCQPDAPGSPLNSTDSHVLLQQTTRLHDGLDMVRVMAQSASEGTMPYLRQCYGEPNDYVRLTGGESESEGRVEVFGKGEWGTICDDDFDAEDAKVICLQLGYQGGVERSSAFFGQGTGPVLLTGLWCMGDEESVYQCARMSDGVRQCSHSEDAGVVCSGKTLQAGFQSVGNEPIARANVDNTEGTIILDVANPIPTWGPVMEVRFYAARPFVAVQIQIWQKISDNPRKETETYRLSSSYWLMPSDKGNHTQQTHLFASEGEFIGIYYSKENPIPYDVIECYDPADQLRYHSDLVFDPGLGMELDFYTAPLAVSPCRLYSLMYTLALRPEDVTAPAVKASRWINMTNVAFLCDFEWGWCDTTQDHHGNVTWEINSESTPSAFSGPEQALQGTYYVYATSERSGPDDKARLISAPISEPVALCLKFIYHMLSVTDLASLNVLLVRNGTDEVIETLWQGKPSTQNRWNFENLLIGPQNKTFQIAFEGIPYMCDIAVDDIIVEKDVSDCFEREPLIIVDEAPPQEVTYVSDVGYDFGACGDASQPCWSIEYSLSKAGPFQNLILEANDSSHEFVLSMENFLSYVPHLNITGLKTDDRLPRLKVIPFRREVRLDDDVRWLGLNYSFHNLKLMGNISIDCGFMLNLVLGFYSVKSGDNDITIMNCANLETVVEHSSFNGTSFYLDSRDAVINVRESVFMGGRGNALNCTVDEVESDISGNATDAQVCNGPETRETTLFLSIPNRNLNWEVGIYDSQFLFHSTPFESNRPSGALAAFIKKKHSSFKLLVVNTTFAHNTRAIDISLKGESVIELRACTFEANRGEGSGGAVRISATMNPGFDQVSTSVAFAKISIDGCTFDSNIAVNSELYSDSNRYYPVRAPGNGGALFVMVTLGSYLPSAGGVTITNTSFLNNTAQTQAGSIYFSSKLSASVSNCYFSGPDSSAMSPRTGDIMSGGCNLVLSETAMEVTKSKGTTSLVAYQSSEPLEASLRVQNVTLKCAVGYQVNQVNTSMMKNFGFDSLHLFCHPCTENTFSLDESSIRLEGMNSWTNEIHCLTCPYGGECRGGIRNMKSFWGKKYNDSVTMYGCPEKYCNTNNESDVIAYDTCEQNRYGTLCGHCQEGYSEALFGTKCIPNSDCGWGRWFVAGIIAIYGLFYLLFFMFQEEWTRFLQFIYSLTKRQAPAEAETEQVDPVDGGYFPIFMYFIQTSSLLQVAILLDDNGENDRSLYRPNQIIPSFVVGGIKEVLGFDILQFQLSTCFLPDLTPVGKIGIQALMFFYLFSLLLFIYLVSGCCCFWMPFKRKPKLCNMSMGVRMLTTFVALFLYTYQNIAETAFVVLNCVDVGGESVLFYDGNITCLRDWQIIVIIYVVVFIMPFFLILLLGPPLLQKRRISLSVFFLSMILPLVFVPFLLYQFLGCNTLRKTLVRHLSFTSNAPNVTEAQTPPDEDDEARPCCGDSNVNSDAVVGILAGPYRDDIIGGLCWEGVMNFRRLILVILATFTTNVLLRHMLLSVTCLFILIGHMRTRPFKEKLANLAETASLALLLIISMANVVRAVFLRAGIKPRGEEYIITIIYEWIELSLLNFLPLILGGLVIIVMLVKVLVSLCQRIRTCKVHPRGENLKMPPSQN